MRLLVLFLLLSSYATVSAQTTKWWQLPAEQWPQIALINEVWYRGGERYVHPSFEYAATGFLLDTGADTLAITAKHVLWIAKSSGMKSVDFGGTLDRWVMRPKAPSPDSVVIDDLLNADPGEQLQGPGATITQRDWLVFSTAYVSPNLQPLRASYRPVKAGETIWYTGCPYQETECITAQATVLEVEGQRIVFSKEEGVNIGGASGSPLIDQRGRLVGILGGGATAKSTGAPALYGLSTHYLRRVLRGQRPLNTPLRTMSDLLGATIKQEGLSAGQMVLSRAKKKQQLLLTHDFSPESFNALARELADEKLVKEAIGVYQLSLAELPLSGTHYELGQLYLKQGDTVRARQAFLDALALWPENESAKAALEQLD